MDIATATALLTTGRHNPDNVTGYVTKIKAALSALSSENIYDVFGKLQDAITKQNLSKDDAISLCLALMELYKKMRGSESIKPIHASHRKTLTSYQKLIDKIYMPVMEDDLPTPHAERLGPHPTKSQLSPTDSQKAASQISASSDSESDDSDIDVATSKTNNVSETQVAVRVGVPAKKTRAIRKSAPRTIAAAPVNVIEPATSPVEDSDVSILKKQVEELQLAVANQHLSVNETAIQQLDSLRDMGEQVKTTLMKKLEAQQNLISALLQKVVFNRDDALQALMVQRCVTHSD